MEDKVIYLNNNFEISDIPTEIAIDDKIVDIIITLNKKRYKTIACCSGHFNENVYYDFDYTKSISSIEDLKWISEHLLEIISEDEKKYYCRGKVKGNSFCIFFDKDIHLPFIPEGFEQRGNSIWHDIDFYHDKNTCMNRKNKDEIEKELKTIHNEVREWLSNLPELQTEYNKAL